MRRRNYLIVALVAWLCLAATARAQSVSDRLHQGIYQEETIGDLETAGIVLSSTQRTV